MSASRSLEERLTEKRTRFEDAIRGSWIWEALGRDDKQSEFVSIHAQLELLVGWARGARGAWPGIEVSDSVRSLEQDLVLEAEKLLDELHTRFGDGPPKDEAVAQRRRDYLGETLSKMRVLRGELAAVLAVFIERDPAKDPRDESAGEKAGAATKATPSRRSTHQEDEIKDAALRQLVFAADQNFASAGPEVPLALAILCCAPLYAVLAWQGYHPMFASAAPNDSPAGIIATAGLEVARLLAVLWIPVLGAFSVRQYLRDRRNWVLGFFDDPAQDLRQLAAAMTVALIAGLFALVALAILWAFLVASSDGRFQILLFSGAIPFLLFYPSMILITLPAVGFSLMAADARDRHEGFPAFVYALMGAALVAAAWWAHLDFWYGGLTCTEDVTFARDAFASQRCMAFYGSADIIIMPLLTLFTAFFFGNPERRTARETMRRDGSWRGPRWRATTPLLLMAIGGLCLAGSCARAPSPRPMVVNVVMPAAQPVSMGTRGLPPKPEQGEPEPPPTLPARQKPIPVRLGFRADAEPFSFRRDDDDRDENGFEYKGYTADLCHEVFSAPRFEITEVPVTGTDRFTKLRDGSIDVLCDPVTLRYSDPERRGIYSPVVFTSSISFLKHPALQPRKRVEIAYLAGSTSDAVARRLCEADYFAAVDVKSRKWLQGDCAASWAVGRLGELDMVRKRMGELSAEAARLDAEAASLAAADPRSERARSLAHENREEVGHLDERAKKLQLEALGSTRLAVNLWVRYNKSEKEEEYKSWSSVEDIPEVGNLDAVTCSDECVKSIMDAFSKLKYENECSVNDSGGGANYKFCPMQSHDDIISWFCSPRIMEGPPELIYLGDRDLIVGKLRTWNKFHPACEVESASGGEDLTYEPYALLINETKPELVMAAQRGIYSFFSRREHANRAFAEYFKGQKMSSPLAYLFLLNGVEQENSFTLPDQEPEITLVPSAAASPGPNRPD